jgi:replicative DNA helicase
VVNICADKATSNSNEAAEYLRSQLPKLQVRTSKTYVNIISEAKKRLAEVEAKAQAGSECFIPTGFPELDNTINGWARGEEFIVWFARTGQGKSWVLVKSATHAWEVGYNVGYISPEMSSNRIGYRFDTHYSHFSNADLLSGRINLDEYREYINSIQDKPGKFIVAVPEDFNKRITVSKLRTFVKDEKLDMLCIDGIRYLSDERAGYRDNMTTSLTNISEDLMSLSRELSIPILVVVQSNRGGVKEEDERGTPELENIRDSDGIAHNATKVISLRQTGPGLEMGIKKNRDGATNVKLVYTWDIDTGIFTYIPGEDDVNTIRVSGHNNSNNSNNSNTSRRTNSSNDNHLANVQPERKVFSDVTSPF